MQYTLSPTTFGTDQQSPLYASVDGRIASLGGTHCIFHVARNGQRHVLTHDVLRALEISRQFATLDQHAQRACDTIPALKGHFNPIRKAFEDLADRGLLMSADEWITQMHQGPSQTEPAAIQALYIRTCDRADSIERLLTSLQPFSSASEIEIRVIDDSRTEQGQQATAAAVQRAGAAGLNAIRIGRDERMQKLQTWAKKLKLTEQESKTYQWLLEPGEGEQFSGGAALNFIILDSAGKRFLCLDDDFVVRPRQHQDASGKALFAQGLPDFVRFCANAEEMEGALQEADVDPLAAHVDTCGRTVAELLDGEPGRLLKGADLRGKTLADLDHLCGASRVVVSTQGAWGHGRSENITWVVSADKAARDSAIGDEDRYQAIRSEPRALCTSPSTFIGRFLTFTPTAVDNSQMVPFTAPTGRGEDYLLSALIGFCYPRAAFVHFPWALEHRRQNGHQVAAFEPWTPVFSRMIAANARLEESHCLAESATDRLHWLAAHTRSFATASAARRMETIEEFNVLLRSGLLEQLERRLAEDPDAPDYWSNDVAAIMQANGTALTKGRAIGFADWPDLEPDDLQRRSSEQAHLYADAMDLWPKVWAVAAADD